MTAAYLLYGANGYTGELVAREAVRRGQRPVLAGRNGEAVAALARELGLEYRTFGLEQPGAMREGIAGMQGVLNCAGPFVRTAWPLIEACLHERVHYADITGEIGQFERCAARSAEAAAAGVMLLPGAGFDVVPSDCLAARLAARLPRAERLVLGIQTAGGYSRGTAVTAMENAHQGAFVRENGRIVAIPAGSRRRSIDFGRGPVPAVIMPWGDVATAYHSTGIPNIEVYFAFAAPLGLALAASRYLRPLLRLSAVQSALVAAVRAGKPGPDARQRARGYALLWGEASAADGQKAVARLRTPESYVLTALAATLIMERVLAGDAPPGYQTPSSAYGAGLIMDIPGVAVADGPEPVFLQTM